jgi:hypothetical protein
MGLYTVAKHQNIDNQMSEAMYTACGIIWRVVADCQDRTLGLTDPKGFGLSSYAVPLSRVLPRISRVQR